MLLSVDCAERLMSVHQYCTNLNRDSHCCQQLHLIVWWFATAVTFKTWYTCSVTLAAGVAQKGAAVDDVFVSTFAVCPLLVCSWRDSFRSCGHRVQ